MYIPGCRHSIVILYYRFKYFFILIIDRHKLGFLQDDTFKSWSNLKQLNWYKNISWYIIYAGHSVIYIQKLKWYSSTGHQLTVYIFRDILPARQIKFQKIFKYYEYETSLCLTLKVNKLLFLLQTTWNTLIQLVYQVGGLPQTSRCLFAVKRQMDIFPSDKRNTRRTLQ